jgi:hypothetical protein
LFLLVSSVKKFFRFVNAKNSYLIENYVFYFCQLIYIITIKFLSEVVCDGWILIKGWESLLNLVTGEVIRDFF